jgi:carboxypeptidase family protein
MLSRRILFAFAVSVLVALVTVSSPAAQGPRGVISGVVVGYSSREPIADAKVSVVLLSPTSLHAEVMTDEAGRFEVPNLTPGPASAGRHRPSRRR